MITIAQTLHKTSTYTRNSTEQLDPTFIFVVDALLKPFNAFVTHTYIYIYISTCIYIYILPNPHTLDPNLYVPC